MKLFKNIFVSSALLAISVASVSAMEEHSGYISDKKLIAQFENDLKKLENQRPPDFDRIAFYVVRIYELSHGTHHRIKEKTEVTAEDKSKIKAFEEKLEKLKSESPLDFHSIRSTMIELYKVNPAFGQPPRLKVPDNVLTGGLGDNMMFGNAADMNMAHGGQGEVQHFDIPDRVPDPHKPG